MYPFHETWTSTHMPQPFLFSFLFSILFNSLIYSCIFHPLNSIILAGNLNLFSNLPDNSLRPPQFRFGTSHWLDFVVCKLILVQIRIWGFYVWHIGLDDYAFLSFRDTFFWNIILSLYIQQYSLYFCLFNFSK